MDLLLQAVYVGVKLTNPKLARYLDRPFGFEGAVRKTWRPLAEAFLYGDSGKSSPRDTNSPTHRIHNFSQAG